jgi:RNA polymerase sigma-70 factor (ECF subfamily)
VTPEKVFDRRWALALLGGVLARLRAEMEGDGKGALFDALKDSLGGTVGERSHWDVAEPMGMSEGAVRVAAHRMRRPYRELLRAEIAQTVAGPGEIEDEIRHLFAALA